MPCGCFGKKKTKEEPKKVPPIDITSKPSSDLNEDDAKNAKNRNIVASDYGDECALLGYRPTGSRPPSSYVDSPTSNSHTNTPSTIPVIASSASSQTSSIPSSPSNSRMGASARALLAEKRREFFRDFIPEEKRTYTENLPSTLPTAARARQFGKVRTMRPLSQPTPSDPPVPGAPPPGPHLLRSRDASRVSTKIDANESSQESGFANPDFLYELKNASDEISRRWAMSDEERETFPSSLKMRVVTPENLDEGANEDTQDITIETSTIVSSTVETSLSPISVTSSTHSFSTFGGDSTSKSVPETLITPPSPPSAGFSDEFVSYSESEKQNLDDITERENRNNTQSEKDYVEFLIENKTIEESVEDQDDFDDLMLKKISNLEDDSFDLSDELLHEEREAMGTSFTNPHAEGGPLFTDPDPSLTDYSNEPNSLIISTEEDKFNVSLRQQESNTKDDIPTDIHIDSSNLNQF